MIVFYISRLAPGDPLVSYYGERVEKMSPEEHDRAMEKLGLNESVSVQYVKWLSNAFHGEFGISYKYKMDVLEVISGRVGNTMLLGGIGFVLILHWRCYWEFCVHGTKKNGWIKSYARSERSQAVYRSSGFHWY